MTSNNQNTTTNTAPLQDITNVNNNDTNLPLVNSTIDNKIDSALLVRNRCSRIEDCIDEINREMENPENMNETELRNAVIRMKRDYLPMIQKAVHKEIPESINHLHAIPGLKNTHRQKEVELKRKAKHKVSGRKKTRMSYKQRMIRNTVIDQRNDFGVKRRRQSLPINNTVHPLVVESPTEEEIVPPPPPRRKKIAVTLP